MKIFRSLLPPLILAALSFAYFSDVLLSDTVFSFRDLSRYYYPLRLFAVNLMKSGSFPFWNPYVASGHPLFATLQSVVLYPLSIIYYLGNFDTAFNIFVILHVFLGGLFFYFLMRDLKFDQSSALISAIVFSFSGYFISVINLTTTLAAAIWFPLIFLFYNRLLKDGKFIYLVLVSVFLGFMFLGGEPTPLYATIFLLGLYTLIVSRVDNKSFPKALFPYILCIGIFILLFSFQIVPFLELIKLSDRAASSFDKATYWSFHPRNTIDFLLPFFHGPLRLQIDGQLRQEWLLFSYFGIVPVVLFLISFIFRRDKYTFFFKICFIIGLIFAFGRFTPLYKFFYKYMPGFGFIRYPVKFFFINAASFAYLCGAGFSEYREKIKAHNLKFLKFIKRLFIAGFIAAILLFLSYAFREQILSLISDYSTRLEISDGSGSRKFYATLLANFFNFRRMLVFFILGALFMFIGSRKKIKQTIFASLIVGLIFIDLYGGKNIDVNPVVSREVLHTTTSNIRILKEDNSLFRIYTSSRQNKVNEILKGATYEEAMLNSADNLCPNRPMDHGIYGARGYLSVRKANYAKVLMLADTAPLPSSTNILNMLNVKYILTPKKINDRTCRLVSRGSSYLYKNKNALNRVYLVPDYILLKEEIDIANRLKSKKFNPAKEVILEEEPMLRSCQPSVVSRKEKEYVNIINYGANEVIIKANVKKEPKFLVLADNYYPGWEVEVDGRKDKIYKANFILRGVYLAPGKHTVRFFYNPVSFKIGLAISLITAVSLIIIGVKIRAKQ